MAGAARAIPVPGYGYMPPRPQRVALSAPASDISHAENRRMLRERFGPAIRARFDAQFETSENRRHFALADAASVDAGANALVRRTLRNKCRYEYHNNSYFQGMADTIGNYVIGTGPRLQMLLPDEAGKKINAALEKLWGEWAAEIRLASTLKTMRVARTYNGEAFALMRTNPTLLSRVKLDVFQVEADQVTSPPLGFGNNQFDGVVLDAYGKPQTYHILRQHPGAVGTFVGLGYEFDAWPARYVIHDFKEMRPGQQRGIPEALPALLPFADLRRFAAAVRAAAETAADYALVIKTQGGAPGDTDDDPAAFDEVEIGHRMAVTLPYGTDIGQAKAEQPTTTFEMFSNATLREIARCLNVPLFFLTLDATQANMSSAYVAIQPFIRSVQVDREGYNTLLDRILDEFLTEVVRLIQSGELGIEGLEVLPEEFPHTWRWPRIGNHADPAKTASAQQLRIETGVSSLPHECAEEGLDWEEVQQANADSLGMTLEEYRAACRDQRFPKPPQIAGAMPGQAKPEQKPEEDEKEE